MVDVFTERLYEEKKAMVQDTSLHIFETLCKNRRLLSNILDSTAYNLEEALDVFKVMYTFREKNRIDLLEHSMFTEMLAQSFCVFGGHSLAGWPIIIVRVGEYNGKKISPELYTKYIIYLMDIQIHKRMGRGVDKHIVLIDLGCKNIMGGVRLSNIKAIIHILTTQYPGYLGLCAVVHLPKFYRGLWTLISYFIDESTKAKIKLLDTRTQPNTQFLLKFIAEDVLEETFGGTHPTYDTLLSKDNTYIRPPLHQEQYSASIQLVNIKPQGNGYICKRIKLNKEVVVDIANSTNATYNVEWLIDEGSIDYTMSIEYDGSIIFSSDIKEHCSGTEFDCSRKIKIRFKSDTKKEVVFKYRFV